MIRCIQHEPALSTRARTHVLAFAHPQVLNTPSFPPKVLLNRSAHQITFQIRSPPGPSKCDNRTEGILKKILIVAAISSSLVAGASAANAQVWSVSIPGSTASFDSSNMAVYSSDTKADSAGSYTKWNGGGRLNNKSGSGTTVFRYLDSAPLYISACVDKSFSIDPCSEIEYIL